MSWLDFLVLASGGLVAGFIDSIAGGGGLITLPLLGIFLGVGADAIGSNKIVGTMGALVALIVYARAGYLPLRRGLLYALTVGVGSVCGSIFTPRLAPSALFTILLAACAVMAILVASKPYWWPDEAKLKRRTEKHPGFLYVSSFFVGFYDGAIGPGGGTFMYLTLLLFSPYKLMECLALSKLANTFSAGSSLVSYSIQGHVYLLYGIAVAIGMSVGAFLGARIALTKAEKLLRPTLLIVTLLLLWKIAGKH